MLLQGSMSDGHLVGGAFAKRVRSHQTSGAVRMGCRCGDRSQTGSLRQSLGQSALTDAEGESIGRPSAPQQLYDAATPPVRTEVDGTGQVNGSWLVMGDAKDYERVRSRIDDGQGPSVAGRKAEPGAAWGGGSSRPSSVTTLPRRDGTGRDGRWIPPRRRSRELDPDRPQP